MNISVYITSYNQKNYLEEAIDSVLNQTLRPLEIIIIDDASSDGSPQIIRKYQEEYPELIRPIFNTFNEGISRCRTKAISSAKGDYLTWVDGDDSFLPRKLEEESKLLSDGQYHVAFSNCYYAENQINNIIKIWAYNFKELPRQGNMFKAVLTRSFPRGNLFRSEMINLKYLRDIDLYDEKLNIYEDYDFRIRLSSVCNITYTVEPLSVYRLHGSGLSRASKQQHYDSFKYIFSKYEKLIQSFPEDERILIMDELNHLMDQKNPQKEKIEKQSYKISFKKKAKLKLLNMIKKL